MIFAESIPLAARADFFASPRRADLLRIREHDMSVAIWRRSLDASFSDAVAAWAKRAELAIDRIVGPDESAPAAAPELQRLPSQLADDVAGLLCAFRELSDARRVRLTLALWRDDACRKFHTDFVQLRMITTYFGPGTEWVPGYAVERDVLAAPPLCPDEANRRIVLDRRAVRRARAGDVLLLKGEQSGRDRAAVHRSPPIAARKLARLVLTLTTAG